METTNTTVGLSRTLEQFISGIDNVEKYIGKDFVFHDSEVDSENIDRDGTVKVRLWTWSDVDYEKLFHADFTLYERVDVRAVNYDPSVCYVYELRFEVKSLNPEIITIIFNGVGFSCRKISVCVSERGLDLAHERFEQGLV